MRKLTRKSLLLITTAVGAATFGSAAFAWWGSGVLWTVPAGQPDSYCQQWKQSSMTYRPVAAWFTNSKTDICCNPLYGPDCTLTMSLNDGAPAPVAVYQSVSLDTVEAKNTLTLDFPTNASKTNYYHFVLHTACETIRQTGPNSAITFSHMSGVTDWTVTLRGYNAC